MKVSQWLTENADSHGIFPAEDLDGLALCDNVRVFQNDGDLTMHYKDRVHHYNLNTPERIDAKIKDRGLGGTFNPGDHEYFFVGWELALTLCLLITKHGTTKMGRGGIFRDSVRHIAEAGE